MDAQSWDEKYRSHDQLFSGSPNGVLVTDLVSVQYFSLPQQPDHTALRGLLDAVAPGGTLLIGSHDLADLPPGHENGFDPSGYYQPADVAGLLDDT